MLKKNSLFVSIFILLITCIFFSKVIFQRQVPFPGDLLVDTAPFITESYLGYAPGGFPNKAQGRDVIAQLYPWKYFSIQQLKNHTIPLWNPYNFSGNIHLANYQTGVFYPLNIIFLFFPFSVAWTIFIMLQPILGLLFMYFLLKDMKLNTLSSLIGGVAFGFSSYMIVWLEWGNIGHTILWLPLLLFFTRRFLHEKGLKYPTLLIFSGVCALLAGYIQGAFYILSVTFLYGLVYLRNNETRRRKFIIFILSFVIMGVVASLQILPTIGEFLESTRGSYLQSQIQNLLQPWYYLVTIFSSEFFGNPATRNFYLPITYFERVMYPGIPILFFAVYGFKKVRNTDITFFGIVAIVTLILTTNLPGISLLYSLPIPIISTTVPTRLLSIFLFSLAILGAYGIDFWMRKKEKNLLFPVLFLGVYIFLWVGIIIAQHMHPEWIQNLTSTKHNLVLATFFALSTVTVFSLRYKSVKLSSLLLTFIVITDLFYIFTKFTPFSDAKLLFPKTPVIAYLQEHEGLYRSWGYGTAYIPANYQTEFGIYSADGYDPLYNKYYAQLLNSSIDGKVHLPLSRTDANIVPGYGTQDLTKNQNRQKILDLLGVKYLLNKPLANSYTPEGTFPSEKYMLIWHDTNWQIYENKDVMPRFFLANKYEIVTPQNEIGKIYSTDLRNIVLLSQKPNLPFDATASGSVRLIRYQPNIVSFETQSSGNQLLFFSDSFEDGWRVKIDNTYAPLYRADVAFRGVAIPKGEHTITFSYEPWEFQIGLTISLVTVVIGGSFLLVNQLL